MSLKTVNPDVKKKIEEIIEKRVDDYVNGILDEIKDALLNELDVAEEKDAVKIHELLKKLINESTEKLKVVMDDDINKVIENYIDNSSYCSIS